MTQGQKSATEGILPFYEKKRNNNKKKERLNKQKKKKNRKENKSCNQGGCDCDVTLVSRTPTYLEDPLEVTEKEEGLITRTGALLLQTEPNNIGTKYADIQ